DRLLVDERVELQHDPGLTPCLGVGDLPLDELEKPAAQAVRGDEESAEGLLPGQAGEDVEQLGDVRAQLGAGREEAEVGVQAGGLRVVVAGPDVDVTPKTGPLAAHDESDLRVGLEP